MFEATPLESASAGSFARELSAGVRWGRSAGNRRYAAGEVFAAFAAAGKAPGEPTEACMDVILQ